MTGRLVERKGYVMVDQNVEMRGQLLAVTGADSRVGKKVGKRDKIKALTGEPWVVMMG